MSIAEKLKLAAENNQRIYNAGYAKGKALEDSILDGSLTAYFNDRITKVTGRNYIFGDCVNLQSVDMPNVTDIRGNAFRGCSALTNVNLPKLTLIDAAAFYACSSLSELDLPCVTQIATAAFVNCSTLKTIILRSKTVCSLAAASVFQGTPIASGTGYVYVPDELVDSYKTATNWTARASQIKPISELEETA